ncbi:MAG TPA: UvrD-helicase domain-containing protein [Ramlibacter sp.]|jgi:ATP-dependent helicase/nuclease subunit A|uniref:UvrD-helicase domain-containing protein n=1 Tax=Ramlibacter sp. TaxID=1917967 RepID=UPI002D468D1A|nr:UvrD-helicase domain-containing protein [Ramlibacter sp.]HZY18237.1 UvrD-helicase domain-containing protein [Ramlibacter sp.]
MTDAPLAYEINGERADAGRFYAVACDPRRSVAVEACAGAGKTWMLVSRILRALLDGAEPHEILAITFTKKAAGEMRERLQHWLADFAGCAPERLGQALLERGVPPSQVPALREPLRTLHARLLEAGRGVQIRTFHSWFAALLRNAPLATLEQLGLPARHTLLEDDSEAIGKVWRRFHVAVHLDAAARADFEASVAVHGRSGTRKALESALSKRVEFVLAEQAGVVQASVQPFGVLHPALAGLERPEQALSGDVARARWLARARELGAQDNKTPRKAADAIVSAFEADDLAERLSLLRKGFFVASEDRLTQHLARVAAAQDAEPELQLLCRACAQHEAWLHHQRMARLSRLLLAEFAALKREEGWVDMADVEQAAHRLLSDEVLAGWVQERLDARVRHLLVDEFQDTNPLQWQALHAWLSGYAGAGGNAPSVFIVGDPKQSIYRFRRAEPQVFAAAQRFVVEGLGGDRLSCDHTRRNAPQVLDAVNQVMGAAQQAGEYQGFRPHSTASSDDGRLLRLPSIPRPSEARQEGGAGQDAVDWRDSLLIPRELPEERLVTLECRQAARWLASRVAQGLRPGEILVLARRRDRLAAMEDELRTLRIPAQQPEKTDLCEMPEVQDVAALLDVLVSPTHDLSLARAIKSPLLGLGDEALVALATRARQRQAEGAPRPWLELLQREAGWPEPLAAAGVALARWQQWVGRLPPHDALNAIFHDGDVLARYAQATPPALRASTLANLRALLGAALQLDGGRYATPYAFVRALKSGRLPGPALAEDGAVRLLTVHGAKGLEAPLVLLLDTDAPAARAETMGVLVDWPGEAAAPRRFSFIASETRPPGCNADALAQEQDARRREELNALYVAMTRARRELVVSSVEPRTPAAGSWWQRLSLHCEPVEPGAIAGPATIAVPDTAVAQATDRRGPPGTFLLRVVPPAPARAAAAGSATRQAEAAAGSEASRVGELLHRLLELHGAGAGQVDPLRLAALGRTFGVDADGQRQARAMAGRIATGEGAWAWDPAHVAWAADEVELVHEGEVLRLDRLVQRRDGGWWVLDYKSAARPQLDPVLREQLRRYARAVAAASPGAPVTCAFLTGEGRLVRLDA